MAKVLISSLGTGDRTKGYRDAKYEYNGKISQTKVISKALTEFFNIEKLFLVGTPGSYWDNCYANFGGTDKAYELAVYEKISQKSLQVEDLDNLCQTVDNYTNAEGAKCFLIEYGKNDDELWHNFEQYLKILDEIDDDDVLYIDITHSFRSLALMSFLMVQFGQVIKNKKFKVGGILYGMFEYSYENDDISPIVDLKIFYDLMEWIKAIDAFKHYSRSDKIKNLLDGDGMIHQSTTATFKGFDTNVSFANMVSLKNFVSSAKNSLNILKESTSPIVKLLSDDVLEFIYRLDHQKVSRFQLELSKWYYENKNYALAFLVLAEAFVSKECEKLDYNVQDHHSRNLAKKELYDRRHESEEGKVSHTISRIRNTIAHQIEKNIDIHDEVAIFPEYLTIAERFIV